MREIGGREVLVLVENDGKKQALLAALPDSVEVEECLPGQPTQPALLILRPARKKLTQQESPPPPES